MSRITTVRLVMVAALTLMVAEAYSMPMFARRTNQNCTACHGPIPRLNQTGFQFRAAGYRMPEDIGKTESPTSWGDFASARMQFSMISAHTKKAAATKAAFDAAGFTSSNQLKYRLCIL